MDRPEGSKGNGDNGQAWRDERIRVFSVDGGPIDHRGTPGWTGAWRQVSIVPVHPENSAGVKPTVSSPLVKAIDDIRADIAKLPIGTKRNILETILAKLELHHRADEQYRFQLYRHGFADGMNLIKEKYAYHGKAINQPESESVIGRQGAPVLGEKGEVPIGGPASDADGRSVRE